MDPFFFARAWQRAWIASIRLWLPTERGYPLPPFRPATVRRGNVVAVDFQARKHAVNDGR